MIHRHKNTSAAVEHTLNSDLSPRGCFYPAIEQGAQVYHSTDASDPDLGALRIILQGRHVIPKLQQGATSEGSGPERIAPATELSKEIPKIVERRDSDVKKQEESMQEVTDKKVEELRQELEEQKRRAQQEADLFKECIAEMQSKEIARKQMVREHRQELEEQKRKAQEEADGFRKRITEMQSELEEDRHRSGKASATYNSSHVPAHPI